MTKGYWTCPNCGALVPQGAAHSCPMMTGYPNNPPSPQAVRLDPVPSYMRLAAALERIATALEATERWAKENSPT